MRIANNLPALSAFSSLNSTNKSLQKTINALSSGLRINSAADDAAGFAVSEKMRSQIRGLDTALRNSQDGISLLQTAEGALGETNSMLQRVRDLAVQASNDSLTSNDRQYIQLEIDQLKDQVDRIASTTQFNKKRLLDGSCGALWSSNDSNVNLKINGGLTFIDEFGQKVSSEDNYRIDVRAEAGETQVQKSNIVNVAFQPASSIERINVNKLSEAVSGNGWNFSEGVLTILGNGIFDISGTGEATTNRILVKSGYDPVIFLNNVNIDLSWMSARPQEFSEAPFGIEVGASADIYLSGENKLLSCRSSRDEISHAALEIPQGAKVTISSANGDGSTDGKLIADARSWIPSIEGPDAYGAGIGGGYGDNCHAGEITINGGTIEAFAGYGSAAIGGGRYDDLTTNPTVSGGKITINGGNIIADASAANGNNNKCGGGAGIGSGMWFPDSVIWEEEDSEDMEIIITGGTINAIGGAYSASDLNGGAFLSGGAGIGGGVGFGSGKIRIQQGLTTITATSGSTATPTNFGFWRPEDAVAKDIGHGTFVDVISDVEYVDFEPFVPRQLPSRTNGLEPKCLSEISQFYNSSGTFLVSQPKTLTITQRDGQTASITIYETDTMYDVAEKINNVIANTFGNARYTDNPSKFCTIADGTEGTSESVYTREPVYDDNGNITGYYIHSTMLIRSAKAGKAGELYFSGDENLLKALGLNTIRESSETTYTSSVYEAHSGKIIANGIKTTGNILTGIIPNVDIEFDSMVGIKSSWDESSKRYVFSESDTYAAYIHLKDNTTTFQTGANQGEDFMIQLGDMSSDSLGISSVSVVTRETASQSISTIDRAINKVSSQRAKIGAYENALEHTMTNLTTTSMNLTSAESRIRDADMSKLMMDFVKLQILNQSGTSMLAQANQLPQSVLSLMQ